ncbi:MAG: hypothetical protein QOG23_931 [Blastocatellia bacterium]|jgi:hypothetical protein|nr:hypothetical protein [Blastocatellia bacterium]
MSGTIRRQLIFLIGFTLLSVITVALVKNVRSQEPAAQNTSSDDSEAIRSGGLREAARIRGHYVGIMTTSHFLKYDLDSLAAHSGNIIVGSPIDYTTHLIANGQLITTWHRIKILQALKGKLQPDETVTISLPGGKLTFDDGTSAEIKTPDLEGMQTDQKYVLFLSPMLAVDGTFTLLGGSQGLFGIDQTTRRIKPNGEPVDPIRKHKDQDVDSFLDAIRATVKKYPEATTCCG